MPASLYSRVSPRETPITMRHSLWGDRDLAVMLSESAEAAWMAESRKETIGGRGEEKKRLESIKKHKNLDLELSFFSSCVSLS
jgi:hypothetical protein